MVTVVNPGPHKSVVKSCICKNCGAELEYTPAEVESKSVSDYGGGSDTVHFIKCPQCTQPVYVNRY